MGGRSTRKVVNGLVVEGCLLGFLRRPGYIRVGRKRDASSPRGNPSSVARTSAPGPRTAPWVPLATLIPATSVRRARPCDEGCREVRRGDGGREGARGLRRVHRQAPEGRAEREPAQGDARLRRKGTPAHVP